MRIGIITVAFNEPEFIVPCIKQFEGFNFPHLVLVSNKPWRGDYQMDNTWALSQMHNINGDTIIDYWPDAASQYNTGLEILEKQGFDWALIVDADEFYTPSDIGRLIGEIRNTKVEVIYAADMSVYWRTSDNLITPKQNDNPIIAIRPHLRFNYIRNNSTIYRQISTVELHHMSYVRSNEQMKKKIETSNHSHEFNTEEWYEEKWLKWTPEMTDLHPTQPTQFRQAIYHPAPREILKLLL